MQSVDVAGVQSPFGESLPAFPDTALQEGTTGLSGKVAMASAFAFYEDVLDAISASRARIAPTWTLLDFGACWGRITRLFMRDMPLRNILGIDVDPAFVDVARGLFAADRFEVCNPLPPTTIESGSKTLVTAYSVFSHLSEPAALAWVEEFARILAPGGFVAFTTRHESFLDYCVGLRQQPNLQGYAKALGTMFDDFDAARARYRAGAFVFSGQGGVAGGGPREGIYGEAFIPAAYVKRAYSPWFKVVAAKFDPARHDQMLFVLQRKSKLSALLGAPRTS